MFVVDFCRGGCYTIKVDAKFPRIYARLLACPKHKKEENISSKFLCKPWWAREVLLFTVHYPCIGYNRVVYKGV